MKNKDYAEADVKDNDTLLKSRKGFFKKSNLIRLLIDIILITGIYITFTYLFEVGYVSSGSMEPYLYEGNFYFAVRTSLFDTKSLERGDVIAFTGYDGREFSKRVIGVGGDRLYFYDGSVYINGDKIDESNYLPEGTETYSDCRSFIVPDGCLFVMGDNRMYSSDSRFWENPYVNEGDVISRINGVSRHRFLWFGKMSKG